MLNVFERKGDFKVKQNIKVIVKCHFSESTDNPDALLDAFIRIIIADLRVEKESAHSTNSPNELKSFEIINKEEIKCN